MVARGFALINTHVYVWFSMSLWLCAQPFIQFWMNYQRWLGYIEKWWLDGVDENISLIFTYLAKTIVLKSEVVVHGNDC